MTIKVSRWDASEYLETQEDMLAYLNEAAATGDAALLQAALGDVAKARGMTQIAEAAGVGRESLYKSLSESGNPSFRTISRVVHALGGTLTITAGKRKSATGRFTSRAVRSVRLKASGAVRRSSKASSASR